MDGRADQRLQPSILLAPFVSAKMSNDLRSVLVPDVGLSSVDIDRREFVLFRNPRAWKYEQEHQLSRVAERAIHAKR